jgi:hypothetical protein
VNGDGYADVLIGAPSMTGSVEADEGVARLYLGGPTGLGATYAWTGEGNQAVSWYGISVGAAGDVNGDGYADLVVGAKDYNDTYLNEGRTFVYYGNGRSGAALALRQDKHSGTPLALLGHTDSNAFRPEYTRRSPFGRGGTATYFEVERLGVLFDGRELRWEVTGLNSVPGQLGVPVRARSGVGRDLPLAAADPVPSGDHALDAQQPLAYDPVERLE